MSATSYDPSLVALSIVIAVLASYTALDLAGHVRGATPGQRWGWISGASLAMGGSIMGPILFFVVWNVIRLAFEWYTQEFGYKLGTSITKDLSGGLMGKITEGASILGMFVIGGLVERWVSIKFTPIVSTVTQSEGAYIDWNAIEQAINSTRNYTTLLQINRGSSNQQRL